MLVTITSDCGGAQIHTVGTIGFAEFPPQDVSFLLLAFQTRLPKEPAQLEGCRRSRMEAFMLQQYHSLPCHLSYNNAGEGEGEAFCKNIEVQGRKQNELWGNSMHVYVILFPNNERAGATIVLLPLAYQLHVWLAGSKWASLHRVGPGIPRPNCHYAPTEISGSKLVVLSRTFS